MACPICEKRKARRFCPARGENICSVCCGTEREVTIDCPSDCPYLIASHQYEHDRREFDRTKMPFPDAKIPTSFVVAHEELLLTLAYAICLYARDHPPLVDADVTASLGSLAETFRTLSSGIYYEKPPDYALMRGLYDALKDAVEEFKEKEARQMAPGSTRDGEIRDVLIFLAQLGAMESNGRPKGRAYLDFLRRQFKPGGLSKPESSIVLP